MGSVFRTSLCHLYYAPRPATRYALAYRDGCRFLVEREAEARVHLMTAGAGESEDAAVELLRDPAFFEREVKDSSAECPAKVGTTLAPVQEAYAKRRRRLRVASTSMPTEAKARAPSG